MKPDVAWFNLGFASFGDRPLSAGAGPLGAGCGTAERSVLACYAAPVVRDGRPGGCCRQFAPAVPGGRLAGNASAAKRELALRPAARLSSNVAMRSTGAAESVCDRMAFLPGGRILQTLHAAEIPIHRILAFGKWGTYKRLELLIEAFNRVATQFPNVELVIGGGDHPKTPGYVRLDGAAPCERSYSLSGLCARGVDCRPVSRGKSGGDAIHVVRWLQRCGAPRGAVRCSGYRLRHPVTFGISRSMRGLPCGSSRQAMPDSLVEQLLLALNSPDQLKEMAWQSYAAGVAMSMPRVVREYIRSFRQHERVKILQLAAGLRRAGSIPKDKTGSPARWARKFKGGRTKTRSQVPLRKRVWKPRCRHTTTCRRPRWCWEPDVALKRRPLHGTGPPFTRVIIYF